MDHFSCMLTFVSVVQRGGFAAAARHLSVGPTRVTQQIQVLEHRIGARLLHRTTRKVTLTEPGQAFYERSLKILEDVKEADAIANAFHTTSRGTLRLNTSPTLSVKISNLVARYIAVHPDTSFELTTTNQMGCLAEERIDLALRDDSITESSLIVRRLACTEWTPCASPGYVARNGLPIHLAELAQHNCLVYVNNQTHDEWRFTDGSSKKAVHISGNLRSSDPHVLRAAALADRGLILLPDVMVSKDLQTGRLIRVLNGYSAEQAAIRAIYLSRHQLSHKVRSFLDFAAATFAASPRTELHANSTPSKKIGVKERSAGLKNANHMSMPRMTLNNCQPGDGEEAQRFQ